MNTVRKSVLSIFVIATTACGGGGGGDPSSSSTTALPPPGIAPVPVTPVRPYPQTDLEIVTLVYSTESRTPPGFYSEPLPAGASYVTTSHLRTSDVDGTSAADATVHEVCSNDWNEALGWSESAAAEMASYGDLVETGAEPRYFEFVRVPRAAPTALVRQRVYRCSYLDRAGSDVATLDGPGGRFNRRPLVARELQTLAEYLWQFTPYNNFGNVVLASAPDPASGELAHGLVIATLTRASTPAACDRVDVVRWSHVVEVQAGAITRRTVPLAVLHARETDGLVSLCEAS